MEFFRASGLEKNFAMASRSRVVNKTHRRSNSLTTLATVDARRRVRFTTRPSTVTLQLHCVDLLYSLVLQLCSSREYFVRQRVARSVCGVYYTSVDRNAATALRKLVVQLVLTVAQQSRVFRQTAPGAFCRQSLLHVRRP